MIPSAQPSAQPSLQPSPQSSLEPSPQQSSPLAEKELTSNANDDVVSVTSEQEKGAPPVHPPPDGGLLAWLQVVGAFCLSINTFGLQNAFGVFESYYLGSFMHNKSPSTVAWIGSMEAFLLLTVCVFAGPLFDKGHMRLMIVVGTVMVVFGMMMTSLGKQFYQVLLSQGFCVGIGQGLLFLPSIAVCATYFSKKRGTAIGLAFSGCSIGGVIYPIMLHRLLPHIHFPWTTRVMGFLALGIQVLPLAVMRQHIHPAKRRAFFLPRALLEPPFTLFCIGTLLSFTGLYVPYFYITNYAESKAGMSEYLAFYMLPIINGTTIIGRVVGNYMSDKVGPLNTIIPFTVSASVLGYAWIGITNSPGLIMFAVLYGTCAGAIESVPGSVIAGLTSNMREVGTRLGMCFLFEGFGVLIGSPIAGAIINLEESYYVHAQLFCGSLLVGAFAFMTLGRIACSRHILYKA